MTQPAVFGTPRTVPPSPEATKGTGDEAASDVDLYASHFTYGFLKDVPISGPKRPRQIAIPKHVLDGMGNMERQYWEIKAAHFDVVVFFKKGKFYELYDCDAVVASREFGLKMSCDTTNRGKMRMAGVPEQSFAEWARLFVFRGHKIGRVEQMSRDEEEEGSTKAKVVPRELVQILTSGTITDPAMITGHHAHFVVSMCPQLSNGVLSVDAFAVDLSRNVIYRCPCTVPAGVTPTPSLIMGTVAGLMHHLRPKEVIVPSDAVLREYLSATNDATSDVLVAEACELLVVLRAWMSSDHGSHELEEIDATKMGQFVRHNKKGNALQHVVPTDAAGESSVAQHVLMAYFHFLKLLASFALDLVNVPTFTAHLVGHAQGQPSTSGAMAEASVAPAGSTVLAHERMEDPGVVLDAAAIDNLELVTNLKDMSESHSLYAFLNRCVTNGGKRLLRTWLLRPSSSCRTIVSRQAAVEAILASGLVDGWGALEEAANASQPARAATAVGTKRAREETNFRSLFSSLFGVDFERNMSRLAEMKRENVKVAYIDPLLQYNKHLHLILSTITGFQEMTMWAKEAKTHLSTSLRGGGGANGTGGDPTMPVLLLELLDTMINVDNAVQRLLKLFDKKKAEKSGTIVPSRGAVPDYDNACDALAELEERFARELSHMKKDVFADNSIAYCDIGKDLFLVEVPLSSVKKAKMASGAFVERSRTTKAVKFVVTALEDDVESYKKATTAKSNALVAVLRTIAEQICLHVVDFYEASSALSYLDCLMALASFGGQGGVVTCRPRIVEGDAASLEAQSIYHPLLSASGPNGTAAVPNSISLTTEEGRLLVLTGPNMAGKSTLMRTVAVNVLLAQLGGFAFGASFQWTPITRVFTRIGARDATHRGQSTLMVELTETSDMLHYANERSLCLVDELGRGTSTHDGYAIAHAALQHLCRNGPAAPLVMFSTHYHALALEVQHSKRAGTSTQLGFMDFALTDASPRTSEGSNVKNIVFLFRLVKGICARSYGVEVAVKAGVQDVLVLVAQEKSRELSGKILEHQMLQLLKEFVRPSNEAIGAIGVQEDAFRVRAASLLALGTA